MHNEFRESFFTRHRRGVLLASPVLAVAGLVLLYNVTIPQPTVSGGGVGPTAGDVPTLLVGALPVT